jgi:hypothetical protein
MRSIRRDYREIVCVVLFGCVAVMGEHLSAAEKDKKQQDYVLRNSQFVMSEAHDLSGKVFYLESGGTPAPKVPVRVWSFEKNKYVQEIETDDRGAYKLKPMEPGNYVIVFADQVRADVRVVSGKKPVMEFLHITVPHGKSSVTPDQIGKDLKKEGKPSYKPDKQ